MKQDDFLKFSLEWLTANSSQIVDVLQALLPVLAVGGVVGVAGYALYVVSRR